MLWLKAFHIVFVVTWFAGIFYLPRLFMYHAAATDAPGIERFQQMERRLFGIMTIGASLTLLFGLTATDAANVTLAVVVIVTVALAACTLPAYRATRIDPLTGIRED